MVRKGRKAGKRPKLAHGGVAAAMFAVCTGKWRARAGQVNCSRGRKSRSRSEIRPEWGVLQRPVIGHVPVERS